MAAEFYGEGERTLRILEQELELDPFAKKGVSFTPGLELVLGDR